MIYITMKAHSSVLVGALLSILPLSCERQQSEATKPQTTAEERAETYAFQYFDTVLFERYDRRLRWLFDFVGQKPDGSFWTLTVKSLPGEEPEMEAELSVFGEGVVSDGSIRTMDSRVAQLAVQKYQPVAICKISKSQDMYIYALRQENGAVVVAECYFNPADGEWACSEPKALLLSGRPDELAVAGRDP